MGGRIQNVKTDPQQFKNLSKFLAKALRHRPEVLDLELDANGWAVVEEVLVGLNRRGHLVMREDLDYVVAHNDKKRYSFDETGMLIRANQGHSIDIDLELEARLPPDVLFHGTNRGAFEAVLAAGIKKMNRQYVHLSETPETATSVGGRRGEPVVIVVNAKAMHEADFVFYVSENGVWLTEEVPPRFLIF